MAVATVTRPLATMSAGYDVLYAARASINALNQETYGRLSAFGSNRGTNRRACGKVSGSSK
ncbi:hypothetical protein GCM10010169_33840 [Micromonospora fulviviridis]|nr:hypothetical protein GCM10010169_33840 [Micromonospora fulviviridis]